MSIPSQTANRTGSDEQTRVARQIVANLIHRARVARQCWRDAQGNGGAALWHEAQYFEARNAAEAGRRILYHGTDAL